MDAKLAAIAALAALFCLQAPPATLAAAPSSPAKAMAGPRLFPDSRIVVRDRISVEVVGRGPDLVLVPGMASSRETWRATAERLRGRYRLHLVQVAGFAGEPARVNATGPVVVPTAEAIDAYIAEQKLAPVAVIGHSLGGTIGLYLAEHHPDHVKKLLIVDALPFFGTLMGGPAATPASLKPMVDAMQFQATANPAGYAQSQVQMISSMVSAPADRERVIGWGKASDGRVVGRAFGELMLLDLRPGLGVVPTPITVIYPDNAPGAVPKGMMDRNYASAYSALPRTTLTRVDGARHFVMFDQPQTFAAALDAFLAR